MEGVLAFQSQDGTLYLPLNEICHGIGFAIEVDPLAGTADGFYLHEENEFHLDISSGILKTVGRELPVTSKQVVQNEMDLYVELDTLNTWFNQVKFAYNASFLLVEVQSNPPLPTVQRSRREQQQSSLSVEQPSSKENATLIDAQVDYLPYRAPMIDFAAHFIQQTGEQLGTELELRGVQDIAKMSAHWYLAMDESQKLNQARLLLDRKDPSGNILGPLHLTEVALGDIGQHGMPLVSRGLRGRGLSLSNKRRELFTGSTTELRGELPQGWDVELYRNDILIAYGESTAKGEYLFEEVALQAGINEFVVVMYGPQGQRREENTTIRIGNNQPVTGQSYIEWSALEQGRDTLAEFLPERMESTDPDTGAMASDLRWVYGLAPGVSLSLQGATLKDEGVQRNYLGGSIALSLLGMAVTLDGTLDTHHHQAVGTQWVGELGETGLLLEGKWFDRQYHSPLNRDGGGSLRSRQELRLNRQFKFFEGKDSELSISNYLSLNQRNYWDLNAQMEAKLGTSTRILGLHLSNTLNAQYTHLEGSWQNQGVNGSLALSKRLERSQLRAAVDYQWCSEICLKAVSLNSSHALSVWDMHLNLSLSHEFSGSNNYGVGLGWSTSKAEFSVQLNHDSDSGESSLNFTLRSALDWSGNRHLPRVQHGPITSQGLVDARVFIDHDGNGTFSPGDEPIKGVRVTPARVQESTNADGDLLITGIGELVPTEVSLEESTLPDPFLRSQVTGYRVMVRPGAPLQLDFPVVWVSDVEGKVMVDEARVNQYGTELGRGVRELGNVHLWVFDDKGKKIREVHSEYDGYFAITNLPSGHYRITIDPEQAQRFALHEVAPLEVVIEDNTAMLSGVELNLVGDLVHEVFQRDAEPPTGSNNMVKVN